MLVLVDKCITICTVYTYTVVSIYKDQRPATTHTNDPRPLLRKARVFARKSFFLLLAAAEFSSVLLCDGSLQASCTTEESRETREGQALSPEDSQICALLCYKRGRPDDCHFHLHFQMLFLASLT